MEVATTAAIVRAQSNLKTPDALIVASALVRRAQAVVTNDASWANRLAAIYPAIRWVRVYDHV
jgi:predicted nucleic acid-binding protein